MPRDVETRCPGGLSQEGHLSAAPQSLRRPFLLRSPEHFRIEFEINPWMAFARQPDPERSLREWSGVAEVLAAAGGSVRTAPSAPEWPDMVFPTDSAIVSGLRFLPSRFATRERRGESRHTAHWLAGTGFTEIPWDCLAPQARLEGGDVVAFGTQLVAGYGMRSTSNALAALARAFAVSVIPVRLIDPRFYHLDMTTCPLDERRAMVVPDAWDAESRSRLLPLIEEPLIVSIEEAMTFCVSSVVIGRNVVMPACPPRIGRQLEAWGFEVCVTAVGEFIKSGGGIRCMALDLDLLGAGRAGKE
jgi:N-dimethylarginine dimethylaminohydrolase